VDPIQKVTVQFGQDDSGLRFELVVPLDASSPVSGCLASRKNVLNHLAYQVTDLDAQAQRLRGLGCIPVTMPAPAVAFDGARIQFHLSPMSFIVELIEVAPQDHREGRFW
jgi:methylmalonyl-CoA/ethylmalonyl-CoA epimerase